jgi:hypothetical protein
MSRTGKLTRRRPNTFSQRPPASTRTRRIVSRCNRVIRSVLRTLFPSTRSCNRHNCLGEQHRHLVQRVLVTFSVGLFALGTPRASSGSLRDSAVTRDVAGRPGRPRGTPAGGGHAPVPRYARQQRVTRANIVQTWRPNTTAHVGKLPKIHVIESTG